MQDERRDETRQPPGGERPEAGRVRPYHGAAGGWRSVLASLRQLWRDKALARGGRALLRVNQPEGFDCPSCAWPEPGRTGRFEFCENGAKAVAFESTKRRVGREFFARHTVTELLERPDHWLESQGRLAEPVRYDAGSDRYVPVSWEEAFARIGEVLRGLDRPDQAVFYTSGRTSNEAAFLYQLFGRLFGTNNFPDCSNMCHESSGRSLKEAIGVGKGTVRLEDFEKADVIFVVGQNPGTNHPRMLTTLQEASRRGAQIVAVNPLREPGLVRFTHPQEPLSMLSGRSTPISTLYLQPVIGGDLAFFTGLAKHVLEAEAARPGEVLDHAFIEEHTEGFEAFGRHVESISWEEIERGCGLSREEIARAGDIYLGAGRVIVCWAMGLTQHKHAVGTIQAIADLLLLRGNIGKPGAGVCPVRGHSNVQGDRTVGITERPPPVLLDRLREVFGFEPPREPGLDTVGAIRALAGGEASVFFAMGGNFAAASPDTSYTEAALRRSELTAWVATKLNRGHLVHGREAYILPCLGRTERDVQEGGPQRVTVEDSMGIVHASAGRNEPASDGLLSEPAIVARLARATLGERGGVPWEELAGDYARIRALIERCVPGFEGYEEGIDRPGGFPLRNAAREREWKTPSGKARFIAHPVPDLSLPEDELRLMTVRSHDQFNTTVYGLDDRYRGVRGTRTVVFLHPDDLESRGLRDGDLVDIESRWSDPARRSVVRGFRAVAQDLPRGCAAAYFPEANPLVSVDEFAEVSRTPVSKSVPVRVVPAATT